MTCCAMSTEMTHAEPQLSHSYRSPAVHSMYITYSSERLVPFRLSCPTPSRIYVAFLYPYFSQDDVSPRKPPPPPTTHRTAPLDFTVGFPDPLSRATR